MTHIAANDDGLLVRDLIAELQRHEPGDRTNISEIERGDSWTRVRLLGPGDAKRQEIEERIKAAECRLDQEEARTAGKKRDLEQLVRRGHSAQAILARLKKLRSSRPLPLPGSTGPEPEETFPLCDAIERAANAIIRCIIVAAVTVCTGAMVLAAILRFIVCL